jgi:hypothetical protein
VLAYLGRYTHRVAITNHRLIALQDGWVSFRLKDYRHHDKLRVMHLDAGEFTRRFLMHTLPGGFHRIRHFGLLANGHRAAKLRQCRDLLAVAATSIAHTRTMETTDTEVPAHTVCPHCTGPMMFDAVVPATPEPAVIVSLDSL